MLLITGITGHTGKYLLNKLELENYKGKIRFLVRETSNISIFEQCQLDYELFVGDIKNPNDLKKATQNINAVIHLYNIKYSVDLFKASLLNNVKKVIAVHTTGIYSTFKIASDEYKEIENKLEELITLNDNKINLIRLRPSMIYGDLCDRNISKFIKMVDKTKFFPVLEGATNLIQPVHAKDLANSCYDVLMNIDKSEIYDITGDRPLEFKYVLTTIAEELGKKRTFISFPLGFGVFLAKMLKISTFNKVDYIEKVLRMSEDRSYSHEKATKDFGYLPITFEEGIKREVEQYKRKMGRQS